MNGWDVGLNCKLGISWNTKEHIFFKLRHGIDFYTGVNIRIRLIVTIVVNWTI